MTVWKIQYTVKSGDTIHDVYTKWSDVVYLYQIHKNVKVEQITL